MDCLSYLSNWDMDMDMIIPETDRFFFEPQFHQSLFQEEAPSQTLLGLNNPHCDKFLLPEDIFLSNLKTKNFEETHNLDSFLSTPKLQKLVNSTYHCNTHNHFSSPNPNFFNSYNELHFVPEASVFPEFRATDFSLGFKVGRGDPEDTKKPTLSSQSLAARERRRKIAEKTHELGKLIPGGQKHNTAEMFQAASKYVKFLQSQVGILQLMQTTAQVITNLQDNSLRLLLESKAIQEKLSTEEVCLVPSEIVEAITVEESIWRNPTISREINKLLSTDMAN